MLTRSSGTLLFWGMQEWDSDLGRNEIREDKRKERREVFIDHFFPVDCFSTAEQAGKYKVILGSNWQR